MQTANRPSEKGGTADNTSRNEIRPLFARVKLAPPLHKHYLYPIKSIQQEPLMSCLFIKSTFSLEIIYSIITTYQILLTGVSISTNGNFALCGNAYFVSCVLSAVPAFLSHARKSKPMERRDHSQSKLNAQGGATSSRALSLHEACMILVKIEEKAAFDMPSLMAKISTFSA